MSIATFGYIILGLIVVVGVWGFFASKKKRWYKVYLANNHVLLLQRNLRERWWRTSDRYMRFINEQEHEMTFPANAHWILMMEEVPLDELTIARDEIKRIEEALAKRNEED